MFKRNSQIKQHYQYLYLFTSFLKVVLAYFKTAVYNYVLIKNISTLIQHETNLFP